MAERVRPIPLDGTGLSRAELFQIEQKEARTQERPTQLLPQRIHVADKALQPRGYLGPDGIDTELVKDLMAAIRGGKDTILPLKVVPIGSRFFLMDGHHRLTAYHSVGWTKLITVEVFDGTLTDAIAECARCNRKNTATMSKSARWEWAWIMVKLGSETYSKSQIEEATGVSNGLIGEMRRKWRTIGPTLNPQETERLTWSNAKRDLKDAKEFSLDTWRECEANEMAKRVQETPKRKALRDPEVFNRMIHKVNSGLVPKLIESWLPEHLELVEELIRENREQYIAERGLVDAVLDI
ncbi:ParB/RepB/Spo0J family partition protein [Methylobacterium sp.]|uniref:ParB/RepB/Spo0J family partition protein n=1 Tax=Methylobacterium sp. TaxID=409 RepID=UPI003AFFBF71